ncbi:hypothetical protein COO91_03415 [Nostoc flagelliforme CCNUN1]|uniref:ASCH domain-containing protein n=2 Tax=Nostoc flagelliforme TaxID=1306274 RepID=A0A2K8SQ49_9NOSO|nr:hypothetical protein COO91_03415 [Nostoc flagelliforme CCNUN1]
MLFNGKTIHSQRYLVAHRGLALVHAGNLNKRLLKQQTLPPETLLPTQSIIGSIKLVGCHWSDEPQDGCEAYAYHWYFENSCLWEQPVPFIAKSPLFDVPLKAVETYGFKI